MRHFDKCDNKGDQDALGAQNFLPTFGVPLCVCVCVCVCVCACAHACVGMFGVS